MRGGSEVFVKGCHAADADAAYFASVDGGDDDDHDDEDDDDDDNDDDDDDDDDDDEADDAGKVQCSTRTRWP